MPKTNVQLKREIRLLKKKDSKKQKLLLKQAKELKERKGLEKDLKELKRSPFVKKLKKLSKKRLTAKQKAKIRRGGKDAVKTTKNVSKSIWSGLGKVVNKLDKINI